MGEGSELDRRRRLVEHLSDELAAATPAARPELAHQLREAFRAHVRLQERRLRAAASRSLPRDVFVRLREDLEEHIELERLLEDWLGRAGDERADVRGRILAELIRRHLERERLLSAELERLEPRRPVPSPPPRSARGWWSRLGLRRTG